MRAPRSSTQHSDIARLKDIRESAELALKYASGKCRQDLDADTLVVDAIVRRILIIGEAARLLSEPTRQMAPAIPWPQIVGARHIMVHEYWRLDLDSVWQIVSAELRPLLAAVEAILARIDG